MTTKVKPPVAFTVPKGFADKALGGGRQLDDLFLELFFCITMMALAEDRPEIKQALAQKIKRVSDQIKHRKGKLKRWLATFSSCFKTCNLCSHSEKGTCVHKDEALRKQSGHNDGCPFFSLSKSAVGRVVVEN